VTLRAPIAEAVPCRTADETAGSAEPPLLRARGLVKRYGRLAAIDGIDLDLWPGEVLAIVGESGSGKSTLLAGLAGLVPLDEGRIHYRDAAGETLDLGTLDEPRRRRLLRSEWGFVHQNPRDGLRPRISAGGNVGEPLMAVGERRWATVRAAAEDWLQRVEIDAGRIDDLPRSFSGGMQQRLQIARNLVSGPRLVLMDEPTGGLDVSVQARLLDLVRRLASGLGLAVLIVTHDLAVARLLSQRMVVMRRGRIVEEGLTDQLLDDPQHAYTQLLVASILRG
jgi:putative phosphonate transport system ATP-binding protein